MSSLSTVLPSNVKVLEEPPPPYTKKSEPAKTSERAENEHDISRIFKTVSNGLQKLFHTTFSSANNSLTPTNEQILLNRLLDSRQYRWATQSKYLSLDWQQSSPAALSFTTYYKYVPEPRQYDSPPSEWPSNADIDRNTGFIIPKTHGPPGVTLWVRYFRCKQKTCMRCSVSFWSARCPGCGLDHWKSPGDTIIQITHPDPKYLAQLEMKELRKTHRPKW
jgi:hypothetical protein